MSCFQEEPLGYDRNDGFKDALQGRGRTNPQESQKKQVQRGRTVHGVAL